MKQIIRKLDLFNLSWFIRASSYIHRVQKETLTESTQYFFELYNLVDVENSMAWFGGQAINTTQGVLELHNSYLEIP